MRATIEKAKADDPKELKREIAELKKQLSKQKPTTVAAPKIVEKRIEVEVHTAYIAPSVRAAVERIHKELAIIDKEIEDTKDNRMGRKQRETTTAKTTPPDRTLIINMPARTPIEVASVVESNGNGDLSGPERRILNAVAWLDSIGIQSPKQTAVAFLAGYTFGGGGFNNPRGALRTKGLIDYRGDGLALTDSGRLHASVPDTPLDSDEMHRRVLDVLPGPEKRILSELLKVYPESLPDNELASRSGYTAGGGGFNNPRGRLRSLGLVDYPERGTVRAADLLFIR